MRYKNLFAAASLAMTQSVYACQVAHDFSSKSAASSALFDFSSEPMAAAFAVAPVGPNISGWKVAVTGSNASWGRSSRWYDAQISAHIESLETDVQSVQYNGSTIYIAASGVPSFTFGPWYTDTSVSPPIENPNLPEDKNYVFRMTRNPRVKTSAHVALPDGPIGMLVNGVPIFSASDANSTSITFGGKTAYWNYNAILREGPEWEDDGFGGHSDGNGGSVLTLTGGAAPLTRNLGRFHVHEYPKNFDSVSNSSTHSPILGFALDGFPIYGPYGYANADGTGGIDLLQSSYRLKRIHARRQVITGTVISGPAIDGTNPLGTFLEDYEFVSGLGDLDEHNARWTVTPEYPDGTWAYFMSMNLDTNGALIPAYPYTIGPTFAGEVTGAIITDGLIPSSPFTTVASRSVPESGLAAVVAPLAALLRRSRPRGRIVLRRFP